jgi:hypothetical protein
MDPDALVVTVFAGLPAKDQACGSWDLITRASSARARVLERIAEDEAATSWLGCRTERWDELDDQHRSAPLDQRRLGERLVPLLEQATEVWLPAGIGSHVDHCGLRDAGLRAVSSLANRPRTVRLYADVPYAIKYGWPDWIDRAGRREFVDPSPWLESEMSRCGLDSRGLAAEVYELTLAMRDRKLQAISEYRTQLAALRMDQLMAVRPDSVLRYEVSWRVLFEADSGS